MITLDCRATVGFCLSTDEKPTENVPAGAMLEEMDTATAYIFDGESGAWIEWLGIDVILPHFRDPQTRMFFFRAFAEKTEIPASMSIDGEKSITDVTDEMTVNGDTPIRDEIRLNGDRYTVSDD